MNCFFLAKEVMTLHPFDRVIFQEYIENKTEDKGVLHVSM